MKTMLGSLPALVAALGFSSPVLAEKALDSASYPIHILYPDAMSDATVQQALQTLESSWEAQVTGMGWLAPSTLDDAGRPVEGLKVHLQSSGNSSHTQPLGDNPGTAWTDCAVDMVVVMAGSPAYQRVALAHELNHALEMTQDCGEAGFAYENTTVAITEILFPDDTMFPQRFLPAFQENPHHGLDCTFYSDEAMYMYHFGAGLFGVFLEEKYGQNDGKLLRRVWEATRQDGSMRADGTPSVPNQPDLLQAMDSVLQQQGVTLREAFKLFAQWRAFVGREDDGQHFLHGADWGGAEVAVPSSFAVADLPVLDATPDALPNELGTVYVDLALANTPANQALKVDFSGDDAVEWNVDLLLVKADHSAEVQHLALDASGNGTVTLPSPGTYAKLRLAASNLGTANHDANAPDCRQGAVLVYSLRLVDATVAPVVTKVEPAALTQGTSVYAWVTGDKFEPGVTVRFSGEGVSVKSINRVDATSLGLDLEIAAGAAVGTRDLIVTNPPEHSTTLAAAVTVAAPPSADDGDDGDSSAVPGCACVGTPRGTGWGAWAVLALMVSRRRGVVRKP